MASKSNGLDVRNISKIYPNMTKKQLFLVLFRFSQKLHTTRTKLSIVTIPYNMVLCVQFQYIGKTEIRASQKEKDLTRPHMRLCPVTRILARLPRCMGMLAKILARSCQDLTKATMIMQDHGKADHASYQAYQDFACILPSFSICLAKHTKIFLSILPIQPGFFHAFCKAFQDSVIRTRYLNRSGNSMICIILNKSSLEKLVFTPISQTRKLQ